MHRKEITELYLRQNNKATYGRECLDELLKFMTIEDMIKHNLLSVVPTAAARYFEEHPEDFENYQRGLYGKTGLRMLENETSAFVSAKKIKEN